MRVCTKQSQLPVQLTIRCLYQPEYATVFVNVIYLMLESISTSTSKLNIHGRSPTCMLGRMAEPHRLEERNLIPLSPMSHSDPSSSYRRRLTTSSSMCSKLGVQVSFASCSPTGTDAYPKPKRCGKRVGFHDCNYSSCKPSIGSLDRSLNASGRCLDLSKRGHHLGILT
jgi:hypothetical protein